MRSGISTSKAPESTEGRTTSQNANITGALRIAAATRAHAGDAHRASIPGVATDPRRERGGDRGDGAEDDLGPGDGRDAADHRAEQDAEDRRGERGADHLAAAFRGRGREQPAEALRSRRRRRRAPSAKRARSRTTTLSAKAKTTLETPSSAQPREHRRPGSRSGRRGSPDGSAASRVPGGVGGAEDAGRGLREAEVVGVSRQQRRDRRVEHRLDEDHRRNQREQPPHASTVVRGARPAFRARAPG